MDFLTWGQNPWAQAIPIRISWHLLYVAAIAGALFIIAHAVCVRIFSKAPASSPEAAARQAAIEATLPERIDRHTPAARAFHWVMAAAMLALLITAFLPIVGLKFAWVRIHWIAGLALVLAVAYHIVHAAVWMDFWSIWPDRNDIEELWRRVQGVVRRHPLGPARNAKYPLGNKAYHMAVIGAGLMAIATGLLMMFRIRTPFLTRNPYLLADQTWGWVYVLHGLAGVATVALTMAHVYFAVRPEKLWVTRSMVFGWIDRRHYVEHHDPARWRVASDRGTPDPARGRNQMTA